MAKHRLSADLRIDFIQRGHGPAVGAVLVVLALAALAWQGWIAKREADVLQAQRSGMAQLRRQAGGLQPAAMSQDDVKRHRQIEQVAARLAMPWDRLLALFEQHATSRVLLLSLDADAATGHVEISGRATSSRALADYLARLESDPRLQSVMLQHHEALRNEAGAPINFKLVAEWRERAMPVAASASAPARPVPAP